MAHVIDGPAQSQRQVPASPISFMKRGRGLRTPHAGARLTCSPVGKPPNKPCCCGCCCCNCCCCCCHDSACGSKGRSRSVCEYVVMCVGGGAQSSGWGRRVGAAPHDDPCLLLWQLQQSHPVRRFAHAPAPEALLLPRLLLLGWGGCLGLGLAPPATSAEPHWHSCNILDAAGSRHRGFGAASSCLTVAVAGCHRVRSGSDQLGA